MISHVRFQDYKILRLVDLDLGPFNVLVGRNGVGKSTILDGIFTLLRLSTEKQGEDQWRTGRPGLAYTGTHAVERLVARPGASAFQVEVNDGEGNHLGLHAELPREKGSLDRFELWFGQPGSQDRLSLPTDTSVNPRLFFKKPFDARLGSVVFHHLDARSLASPHYSDSEVPRVEFDGSGLASVLAYLQGLRDGSLEGIEQDLASVIPAVRRIRTLPARIVQKERMRILVNGQENWTDQTRELTGNRFEVDWADAGWIPAEHLSEGTLLAIGLTTILRFRPPRLVLLDDLDKALHPVAQRDLVQMMKRLVERAGNVQVLATAHSPFVLHALNPDEVLVVGSDSAGASKVCRLDKHPAWEKKGRYLAAGEFWSAIGEGWCPIPNPSGGTSHDLLPGQGPPFLPTKPASDARGTSQGCRRHCLQLVLDAGTAHPTIERGRKGGRREPVGDPGMNW